MPMAVCMRASILLLQKFLQITQRVMDAVINAQQLLYGAYILNDVIDNGFVQDMNAYFKVL